MKWFAFPVAAAAILASGSALSQDREVLYPAEIFPSTNESLVNNPLPAIAVADTAATRSGPKVESLFSLQYGKTVLADGGDLLTVPTRWHARDWRNLGYVGLGLAVSVAVVDKPVRDAVQRSRSRGVDKFLKDIEPFGQKQYSMPLMAGFYLYGSVADSDEARATALDGVAVSIFANMATSTFKGIFGRARPYQDRGAHHWRPLGGDTSFPSGHATQAFAIAAVISDHYAQSPWVSCVSYGTATLVGLARIDHDAHWASDVIAGGLIGTLVGKEVVRFNRERRSERSAWEPEVGSDGQQLSFNWPF